MMHDLEVRLRKAWEVFAHTSTRARDVLTRQQASGAAERAAHPERAVAMLLRLPGQLGLDTPIHTLATIINAQATYEMSRCVHIVEREWDAYQMRVRRHPRVYGAYFHAHESDVTTCANFTERAFQHATLRNLFTNRFWRLTRNEIAPPIFLRQLQHVLLSEVLDPMKSYVLGQVHQPLIPNSVLVHAPVPSVLSNESIRSIQKRSYNDAFGSGAIPFIGQHLATETIDVIEHFDILLEKARSNYDEKVRIHTIFVHSIGIDRMRIAIENASILLRQLIMDVSSDAILEHTTHYRRCYYDAWNAMLECTKIAIRDHKLTEWVFSIRILIDEALARRRSLDRRVVNGITALPTIEQHQQRRTQLLARYHVAAARIISVALVTIDDIVHVATATDATSISAELTNTFTDLQASCCDDKELLQRIIHEFDSGDSDCSLIPTILEPLPPLSHSHDGDVSWDDALKRNMNDDRNEAQQTVLAAVHSIIKSFDASDLSKAAEEVMTTCQLQMNQAQLLIVNKSRSRAFHFLSTDDELRANLNLDRVRIDQLASESFTYQELLDLYASGIATRLTSCLQRTQLTLETQKPHCEIALGTSNTSLVTGFGIDPDAIFLELLPSGHSTTWHVDVASWTTFATALQVCLGTRHIPSLSILLSKPYADTPTFHTIFDATRTLLVLLANEYIKT